MKKLREQEETVCTCAAFRATLVQRASSVSWVTKPFCTTTSVSWTLTRSTISRTRAGTDSSVLLITFRV
jgi:hypothetical protein